MRDEEYIFNMRNEDRRMDNKINLPILTHPKGIGDKPTLLLMKKYTLRKRTQRSWNIYLIWEI